MIPGEGSAHRHRSPVQSVTLSASRGCAPQTRSRCLLHSGSSSWERPFVTATQLHRNSSLVLWLVRLRSYCYTSLAFLWATRVGFLDQVAKRRPSRCVRPLQRSRVENHRTRSQLRSGELYRRTIPSTTSCRPCTRYLASQHGASLLGTLCDVVRNPRCRSVVLFGASTGLSCQARLKPRFRVCQR